MAETPELSKLHRAHSILFGALDKDPEKRHLVQELTDIEHVGKHMHDTLRNIVSSQSLTGPPSDVLESLRELGVIEFDISHVEHIQVLTQLAKDLRQPQKAAPFFDKYNAIMAAIVTHDLLSTQLIAHLLLWKAGLASTDDLHTTIEKYKEAIPTATLSHKKPTA